MTPFYRRLPNLPGFEVGANLDKSGLRAAAIVGTAVAHGVGEIVWHRTANKPAASDGNAKDPDPWPTSPSSLSAISCHCFNPNWGLRSSEREACAIRRRRSAKTRDHPTRRIPLSNTGFCGCAGAGDPLRRARNRSRLIADISSIVVGALAGRVFPTACSRSKRSNCKLCRQQGMRGMPSSRHACVQRHDDGQHPNQASAGCRRAARMRIVPWAR